MAVSFRRSPLALAILGVLEAGPMHPYGIQRRLREWGKHEVVNLQNRAGLYKTIVRLEEAGLIESAGTGREPGYPERTVYRITALGRASALEWLADSIATPTNEYPEFPAALSFAPMIEPGRLRDLLQIRAEALSGLLVELEMGLNAQHAGRPFPRVVLLDTELVAAHTRAELAWVREIIAGVDSGDLTWQRDELLAIADGGAAGSDNGAGTTTMADR
jgi:DNA-binding PadR family transcriptional regulator